MWKIEYFPFKLIWFALNISPSIAEFISLLTTPAGEWLDLTQSSGCDVIVSFYWRLVVHGADGFYVQLRQGVGRLYVNLFFGVSGNWWAGIMFYFWCNSALSKVDQNSWSQLCFVNTIKNNSFLRSKFGKKPSSFILVKNDQSVSTRDF